MEPELVENETCKRWRYLEETDFESLADAVQGSFTCSLFENFAVRFKSAEGEWVAKFEELKGALH